VEPADRFGQNLRRCRRVADLSQEQLGIRAGLHRTEIGLLERGARVPRIDTLLKLAAALDIDPRELIDGIAWRPGTTTPGHFT
jgi:transcriptional regulator with XRE-family HTH domain